MHYLKGYSQKVKEFVEGRRSEQSIIVIWD